ncbi:neutral zinc metallopeptidase [Geodermatophilus sp. URMC 62]|uniref:neutral zinc metallopeptidase n=1 Tax=Geodermatophilus sp. URMC 62 TaxID=3423414 RepID=UPI00406C1D5A
MLASKPSAASPSHPRGAARLILILLSVFPLTGCGDDNPMGGSTSREDSGGENTTSGETLGSDAEEQVMRDADQLLPILNRFWVDELNRLYGLSFDTPDRYEYYHTTGNSSCGSDARQLPQNAYYCPVDQDEYIAFDMDWFASYLPAHPGGATTFLILAHEWGHAVQDTWMEQQPHYDTWNPPYRRELNADCLAGSFLQRQIADGTIIEEEGDANAIFSWLWEEGSGVWFDPSTHGTRVQRQQAFSEGYLNGTDYCRINY